jgi:opacity protein-like surface antigen
MEFFLGVLVTREFTAMKKSLLCVAVLLAVTSVQAAPVVKPMLDKNTQEMSVSGSVDNNTYLGGNLHWRYGYFLQDGIEAGLRASGGFRGNEQKDLGLGLFGEYDFLTQTPLVPFAGAGANLSWQELSSDSVTYMEFTVGGGAKYFFVSHAAVSLGLDALFATRDVYNLGKDRVDWRLVLGTSWYF